MGTPTYPRRTIARVKKAVRDLHFVAYYQCSVEWVNDCMHDYADRAIVYVLASKYEGQEYILYVGKTQAQYTRFIKHSSHYEYDTIYLFECAPELLDKCEAAVIKALCPLFNQHHNPEAERYRMLLGINNEAEQSGLKEKESEMVDEETNDDSVDDIIEDAKRRRKMTW